MFVFNTLAAGAYGAGGSVYGLFAALAAYRFFTGIGIGGEYPAGSVSCSEATGELKSGTRNRWFVMLTNGKFLALEAYYLSLHLLTTTSIVAIDWGFVIATLCTVIVILITGEQNKGTAWRVIIGLGSVWPLSLIYFRWKLQEPEAFKRNGMSKTHTPWLLSIRFYGLRLLTVAAIWFIYDFSAYGFGYYSSAITDVVAPKGTALWVVFGWNTVINLFYIPGAIIGAWVADYLGPRKTLAIGVWLQAIVGFIMAGTYAKLSEHIAAFAVVYGVFLSLGELGPGDNIGLVASKTCATGIRGQYYAIAAAMGKIGGFIGSYVFPIIEADGGGTGTVRGGQYPFFVASSLCILSAVLVLLLPKINQDTIEREDEKFREYLEANGFDTSKMGSAQWQVRRESVVSASKN